jgi:LuxR family maltose regulon positive regulatory protein
MPAGSRKAHVEVVMQSAASSPLINTKLYIPRARPNRVERPRLIARLNKALSQQLTLVCAPAGFGKTTLLSEWIPHCEICVTWLSLDEADNDPIRFWSYFIAAVQTLQNSIGENALALLNAPHLQTTPIESILTALLNDIAAFQDEFALVMEDYHLVESRTIHDALNFLINHIPRQMHLILTSRVDPPLPLARLRARNQLAEIRSADLRFEPDETAVFLNQVMGLDLSTEDIARLEARTEGWVAGLQLAALALRSRSDLPGFIASFTGSNRYIVSYLVEEVLDHQPDFLKVFLLQTSILDRMTAALCAAVSGGLLAGEEITEQAAIDALERLEHANLFIIPLDDERRWYRYHHLFAEVLRSRLQAAHADRVPYLHGRAAKWFESNGLFMEAVQHLLAAKDWDRAAVLIANTADDTAFKQGQVKTVLAWLQTLPEEILNTQPRLSLIRGWILLNAGSIDAVEENLIIAERALPPLEPEQRFPLQGEVATLRAMIASYRREISHTIELCRLARDLLPEQSVSSRAAVANALGLAYRFSGQVVEACEAFTEAIALAEIAGNFYIMMDSVVGLAGMQMLSGQLRAAEKTCRDALLFADEQASASGYSLLDAGFPHIRLGEILRERNDLVTAERFILKGIELGRQGGNLDIILTGHGLLAAVRQAQGDLVGARAAMQMAEKMAVSFQNRFVLFEVATHSARLLLAQGDLTAAESWERSYLSFTGNDPAYLGELARITLARLRMAQKRYKEAIDLLEHLRKDAEAAGRMGSAIEILALEALSIAARRDFLAAITSLERALTLAEPEGYMGIFLSEGEPMRLLIAEYVRISASGSPVDKQTAHSHSLSLYADQLLAAFTDKSPLVDPIINRKSAGTPASEQSGAGAPKAPFSNLLEPLSLREVEVLRLIAGGASNGDIAQALTISLSTVKRHTGNIYNKLGVNSRTQAVARAQQIGLLY